MRPVNLIPPEERRGERAPMRTGPLSYVLVAVLAAALIAVTLTVLVNNQVSDRKAEKANLQSQVDTEQATADRFQSFADFASMQQAREQTVSSLARSRFDWERVLRELAIVIPHDVWLTNMSAASSSDAGSGSTSSPGTSTSDASVSTEGIEGPTLQIQGCASGHEAVARFLASLHDVDGVTRVTVVSSDRPEAAASTGATGATTPGSQGCSARGFVAQFSVIAAFDAVQLGATPESSATPPTDGTQTTTTPTSPSNGSSSETTASTGEGSQVSDAQQQLQQQKDSAASKTQKGRDAVNTFIPGTGSAP